MMKTTMKDNSLSVLKNDIAIRQKKGIHFIIASVIIWILISIVWLSGMPIQMKNLLIFCCSCPLMPIAFVVSRIMHIDFQSKENPLTNLGILFSVNQIVYILIAMWAFNASPENMLLIYCMIFGAHLMPYGWLYGSKAYYILSVAIPIMALVVNYTIGIRSLPLIMVGVEILFTCILFYSNKSNIVRR